MTQAGLGEGEKKNTWKQREQRGRDTAAGAQMGRGALLPPGVTPERAFPYLGSQPWGPRDPTCTPGQSWRASGHLSQGGTVPLTS